MDGEEETRTEISRRQNRDQDLRDAINLGAPPPALVAVNKELRRIQGVVEKQLTPLKAGDSEYDLSKLNDLDGKDISGLSIGDKRREVAKVMGKMEELSHEMEDRSIIWKAERHRARQALMGLSDEEIETSDKPSGEVGFGFCAKNIAEEWERRGASREHEFEVPDVELRFDFGPGLDNTMTTWDTYQQEITRSGRIEQIRFHPPRFRQLCPTIRINQLAYKYMEEIMAGFGDARRGNIRTIGEGTKYPMARIQFHERIANLEKVGTMMGVTDDQLEEMPALRQLMEARMGQWMAYSEDDFIMNGQAAGAAGGSIAGVVEDGHVLEEATEREAPVLGGLRRMLEAADTTLTLANYIEDNPPAHYPGHGMTGKANNFVTGVDNIEVAGTGYRVGDIVFEAKNSTRPTARTATGGSDADSKKPLDNRDLAVFRVTSISGGGDSGPIDGIELASNRLFEAEGSGYKNNQRLTLVNLRVGTKASQAQIVIDVASSASDIPELAKTADLSVPNLISRAFTQIEVEAMANATALMMNPYGWERIRTTQTADGAYLFGSPAERGGMTIWGRTVTTTPQVPDGQAFMGDWRSDCAILQNRGVRVGWGMINDDFGRDMRHVKINQRIGFAVWHPASFLRLSGSADCVG